MLPYNNIMEVPEGITQAAADGYWVFLGFLPLGTRKVHFGSQVPLRGDLLLNGEVTYFLEIT
jgi:hypothetical protein